MKTTTRENIEMGVKLVTTRHSMGREMPLKQGMSALSAKTQGTLCRRLPGRPRKPLPGPAHGHMDGHSQEVTAQPRARSGKNGGTNQPAVQLTVAPISPRLLDLPAAAAYLGVSVWTVRELVTTKKLVRVLLPSSNGGDLRKLLFDRIELDRLIEMSKDVQP